MNSQNKLQENDDLLMRETPLIPKIEPIDIDFIKKENTEEEQCFVVSGIVESMNVDEVEIKKEFDDTKSIENVEKLKLDEPETKKDSSVNGEENIIHPSSKVRLFLFYFI